MYRYLTIISLFLVSLTVSAQTASGNDAAATKTVNVQKEQENAFKNKSADFLVKMAENQYKKANYTGAATTYEAVLKLNGPSFGVHYNLGNAYFKKNELGKAILNYERALRLNPGDQDARFNLEICQARTVDKIDAVGVFLITRWFKSLGNNYNSNAWSVISLLFFILFLTCLFVYIFTRLRRIKKIGFYVGILSLIISILALFYASEKYKAAVTPDQAIIMSPTITAKSSPDESGTDLFPLHEGTKVTLTNEIGSWNEIELQDGNVGWVPSYSLEVI